jgi:hypothetical protein
VSRGTSDGVPTERALVTRRRKPESEKSAPVVVKDRLQGKEMDCKTPWAQ